MSLDRTSQLPSAMLVADVVLLYSTTGCTTLACSSFMYKTVLSSPSSCASDYTGSGSKRRVIGHENVHDCLYDHVITHNEIK